MADPILTPDGRAYVRLTTGELASVPQEELPGFLQNQGGDLASSEDIARREEEKKYGEGLGTELLTGAESAASGATLGLSDVAAKALAPEYAEELAKRREYNPLAAGIGEGVGIVGSTLLTGGESLLAKGALSAALPARGLVQGGELAAAGARKLLAREGAGALGTALREGVAQGVGGVAEGALFAGAKQVSDDYLNDHEITAERVAASMGEGALWGGGLSFAAGAGGSLVGQGVRKLGGVFDRSEADNAATKVLDEALQADAATGASAEAQAARQTLTQDQQTMLEIGARTDDDLVAELSLSPTNAEQQTAMQRLAEMGPEQQASRDFKDQSETGIKSLREGMNDIAAVKDKTDAYLNKGHKEQTVKDALGVGMPEWVGTGGAKGVTDNLMAEVTQTRRTVDTLLEGVDSGKRKMEDAEYNALRDVSEAAQDLENRLTGGKPELMAKAPPKDVPTYKIDEDSVRGHLTDLNSSAPEGMQYVLRYVPIDQIDDAGRPLGVGPVSKMKAKNRAEPIQVRRGEDGKFILEDGARRVAAARNGGLSHVPAIVPESTTAGLLSRSDADGLASTFMAMDDFKGAIGRAARRASAATPQVNSTEAALQRDYMRWRATLENEQVFGKPVASMQRATNAAESEAIRTQRVFDRRFAQEDAMQNIRSGQYGFDTLTTADSKKLGSLIGDLGKEINTEVERDFVLGLMRQVDLMKTKGDYYRLPPELKAEIARVEKVAQGMVGELRTLRQTKELADRYARGIDDLKELPFAGEQLAKLKITASKAMRLMGSAGSRATATAEGGGAIARAHAGGALRASMQGERKMRDAAKGVVSWLRDAGASTAKAAKAAKQKAAKAGEAASLLGVSISTDPASVEHAIRNISALQNPESPERARIRANMYAIRRDNPGLANALEAHAQRVGDFLAKKAGELSAVAKPGDPFGGLRKPRHDPAKAAKLGRYMEAATNPRSALERVSEGEIRREDVEVLQALYPRMYRSMVQEIMMELGSVEKLPSYDARVKLGNLINAPTDPSMTPAKEAQLQDLARASAQKGPEGNPNAPQPSLPPSKQRAPKLGHLYATPTERNAADKFLN